MGVEWGGGFAAAAIKDLIKTKQQLFLFGTEKDWDFFFWFILYKAAKKREEKENGGKKVVVFLQQTIFKQFINHF